MPRYPTLGHKLPRTARFSVANSVAKKKPERLGLLVRQRNVEPKVNGQGAFVPVVKLMRQAREQHVGDRKPGGLYIEMATYWAFQQTVSFGSSFAEIFAITLRSVGEQLATGTVVSDPALGSPYEPAPTAGELIGAGSRFRDLAGKATAALEMDECGAAAVWRQILGKNSDGFCFPLPDGCDERGQRFARIAPVAATGPNEARPFA